MSLAISFGKWQTMDDGNPQNLGAIQISLKNGLPERPQKTTPRPPNFDECLKKSIPRVFSPLSFLIHCLMLTNLPKTIRNLSKTVKAQSGIDQKSVRNQSGIYQTMCKIRQGIGNKWIRHGSNWIKHLSTSIRSHSATDQTPIENQSKSAKHAHICKTTWRKSVKCMSNSNQTSIKHRS